MSNNFINNAVYFYWAREKIHNGAATYRPMHFLFEITLYIIIFGNEKLSIDLLVSQSIVHLCSFRDFEQHFLGLG